MARKTLIQIRRGLENALGTLAAGELGFCTDSGKLYIGTANSGNVLLVAAQSTGDMLKSIYDTNNNGKVDFAQVADSVPWAGIDGKPSVFPPASHTHSEYMPKGPLKWNQLKGV
ncbi:MULTISPECIES: hyaluronate lyase N-terminal domain-containing protein [Paenibacillus]|uniref:Phage tail protein n=1 Tax=Paenibacillus agri TaxID=2744309 RepID=A0A850EPS4_9BACL|nr:phage tail protein [Paenibacillus agri]NUU61284.1 phage tail protein [Paenibacillus agri]